MRRPINEDADTAHNPRISRADFGDNSPYAGYSCSPTTYAPVARPGSRKSSAAFFARGVGRLSSNLRSCPPLDNFTDQQEPQGRQGSESASSMRFAMNHQRERNMPFLLPSTREEAPTESIANPASIAGDSIQGSGHGQLYPASSAKGSLRARRKVNLDLSLPVDLPDLAAQHQSPNGQVNSITPSRPRSPRTPFTRGEPSRFPHHVASKTEAIMEEDYIGHIIFRDGNEMVSLFLDNDLISSSHSSEFEHPPTKARARGYRPRPRPKRSRTGYSAASEDGHPRTPNDPTVIQAQQARTDARLEQLSHAAKYGRQNRWRWARSTTSRSSDGGPTNPPAEPSNRRFSTNPFKRSGRIADQADQSRDSSPPSRLWWIGKQAAASARPEGTTSSALMHVSAPPVFIPPGLTRVPTPPTLDVGGDVKSKLADFFFDHTAGLEGRKPTPSPGGHWDSDALLMSYLSPDSKVDKPKEEEEEGPEGPVTPLFAPRDFTVDHNPGYATPGLVAAPGGHLNAQRQSPLHLEPSHSKQWFRVRQDESTDDSQPPTAQALQEMEERRKFEWIVPEHLPNSPLCPKHPKYTGYSAGICYWHGRRKSREEDPSKMEGDIVGGIYELGQREKEQKGQAEQDEDKRSIRRPKRGPRGWKVGKFQKAHSPGETSDNMKRRLASLSSPV
jgi:hypothetical protein